MFKNLLRELNEVYQGNEIYVPDAIYPLIRDWCEQTFFQGAKMPATANLKWHGKLVLPYDEQKVLDSYQSCPIHVPERILEKSIVIETSLDNYEPPKRKEKKVQPKQRETTRKVVKSKPISFS